MKKADTNTKYRIVESSRRLRRHQKMIWASLAGVAVTSALVAGVSCKSRAFNTVKTTPVAPPNTADRKLLEAGAVWRNDESKTGLFWERENDYNNFLKTGNSRAFDWYTTKPLGLQGLPFLVLKVLAEQYPTVWGTAQEGGVSGKLGAASDPGDYITYGFVSYPDLTGDPATISNTQNTFFSCAACHSSRIVTKINGKPAVRYYIGGPSSEIDAQLFAKLVYETAGKLTNIESVDAPKDVKINKGELAKFAWRLATFDCNKYKPNEGAKGILECKGEKDRLLGIPFNKILSTIRFGEGAPSQNYENLLSNEQEVEAMRQAQLAVFDAAGGSTKGLECGQKPPDPKASPFSKLTRLLVGSGFKVKIMYENVGAKYPFRLAKQPIENDSPMFTLNANWSSGQQEKSPPKLWGPRPGQMDAFGLVQGIVFLNAMRGDLMLFKFMSPEYFLTLENRHGGKVARWDKNISDSYAGNEILQKTSACATGDWNKLAPNMYTQAAALSDIKSLYRSEDEFHANWDGNEGAGARVLASGLSSVGDPQKVFTEIHETANGFISSLPVPPYPFAISEADYASAVRGQALFNGSTACASCHKRKNEEIYNTGTDMNRALAVWSPEMRLALISMTVSACESGRNRAKQGKSWIEGASGLDSNGKYWCDLIGGKQPKDVQEYMSDVYRPLRGLQAPNEKLKPGYKADPLYGIWTDAPYLHNGTVPTLREMLMTKEQRDEALSRRGTPGKFVRGNLAYDEKWVGFMAVKPNANDYVSGDTPKWAEQDVTLRGNDNSGHEFFHKDYEYDEVTGRYTGVPGKEFDETEIADIINYLKLK
jgi:hypothetical protein